MSITERWFFGEVFGPPIPERLPSRDDDPTGRANDAKFALFDYTLQLADRWATEDESRAEIVDRYRRGSNGSHVPQADFGRALTAGERILIWSRRLYARAVVGAAPALRADAIGS